MRLPALTSVTFPLPQARARSHTVSVHRQTVGAPDPYRVAIVGDSDAALSLHDGKDAGLPEVARFFAKQDVEAFCKCEVTRTGRVEGEHRSGRRLGFVAQRQILDRDLTVQQFDGSVRGDLVEPPGLDHRVCEGGRNRHRGQTGLRSPSEGFEYLGACRCAPSTGRAPVDDLCVLRLSERCRPGRPIACGEFDQIFAGHALVSQPSVITATGNSSSAANAPMARSLSSREAATPRSVEYSSPRTRWPSS